MNLKKNTWSKMVFEKMNLNQTVRFQSEKQLFGKPLLDISWGPDSSRGETYGHARGIIAIGQIATGPIAIGIISFGILSFGLVSLGLLSFSLMLSVGLVSFSGLAFGLIAFGGAAFGCIAFGGLAVGYLAVGGCAIGQYAIGGFAIGKYIMTGTHIDPEVLEFLNKYASWVVKSFDISE